MTTRAIAEDRAASTYLGVLAAVLLGLGIVVLTGHVQADALHDAAHDVRHANGFPCH
ncbi:MAG: CbtB-domain containing protein [Boseongicola sp. SB0676_bin_33]|uniref:CbtB-domain containing protein n=1 Tax=Boseongicola sp. SB0664_bin_43 TaxID=2604844 RepID=A0A6B0XX81_9RHOB|nr:CbtB-domain containing protein [Boseongicola sp. SB0664_bin_43]MYF90216.1 CbtB-domain containing protein [Boseongicola sp. SB0676_bin_33]MYK32506.1 CbtB-domain containing protein [Boseongicola sp. SB0670_bin_30]